MASGTCHCLCRLWGHDPTICDGNRDRVVELEVLGGETTQVPVCRPCGADIAEALSARHDDDEREEA